MDCGYKFDSLKEEIAKLSEKTDALAKAYAEAESFTKEFLECCSKYNIKIVSIQKTTKLVNSSLHFPFGANGSIFADGCDESGCPSIWRVAEDLHIGGGCGNSGQHQISYDAQAKLVDGVYEHKNGKWHKVDI